MAMHAVAMAQNTHANMVYNVNARQSPLWALCFSAFKTVSSLNYTELFYMALNYISAMVTVFVDNRPTDHCLQQRGKEKNLNSIRSLGTIYWCLLMFLLQCGILALAVSLVLPQRTSGQQSLRSHQTSFLLTHKDSGQIWYQRHLNRHKIYWL